jgi:hypothetical protein
VNRQTRLIRNRLVPVLILVLLALYQYYSHDRPAVDYGDATGSVQAAYAAYQSNTWLETQGRISRVLRDDNDGSRHQKFILELDDGHTVMIAHNIDLAERIPAREGLSVRVRGRYEWNDRGGVIHWTHHDPSGQLKGGWIEVNQVRYE